MKWKIIPFEESSRELVRHLEVHPLLGQLLLNRGVEDSREAKRFLFPTLNDLTNPFRMKGVEEGVRRVIKAVLKGEKITIYGDYDVDGMTSVALLKGFLSELGVSAEHYIPKRLEEGYGLNPEAIKFIASKGTKLLITVDCGISNRDEIALAQSLGMDTIVLDHHEPPEILPPGIIIDPLQRDCPFPFKGLAAVGVTFLFLMALRKMLREEGFFSHRSQPNLKRYLDLVALGTVADVVPVVEENRIFLKFGFEELQKTPRPGLRALKDLSGLGDADINYEHVAFRLAPRLNAGGRMQKEEVPLRLLLSEDEEEAQELAQELEEANRQRQLTQERIYAEARQRAHELRDKPAIVLASENWHPGVIGIVASKIAEEFYRPTILIALDGSEGRGSGRGIPEVHMKELLEHCRDLLVSFGGHKSAAGLKVKREHLEAFERSFLKAVEEAFGGKTPLPSLLIDLALSLKDITLPLVDSLELLAPFGPGNPNPVFCSNEPVNIESLRRFERDVTRFSVVGRGRRYEAVAFGPFPDPPPKAMIAFVPKKEFCEGYLRLTLEIKGLKESKS
ncbi:MAG: single-stranded-DNA-specific exonuclease RecJ [Deltaproteobacteria bacterium]|nr:MAG: single-stranded-DNA-specific exonuclease RecJ [Deltaproteobacteria bacterium]